MKRNLFFKLLLVVIALFLVSGCGEDEQKGIYDDNGNPVFIEDYQYDMLHSNPNNFVGKFVNLNGKIFTSPERDENIVVFQMYYDVEHYDKNTIIYYSGPTSVKEDDYVNIVGYVLGEYTGTNALGGTVTAPMIYANTVTISSYQDVVAPAKKTMEYSDKTINQHGCSITVNKVEFSDKETRVYVSASNKSNSNFNIYTYSAKLVQNYKQYEQSSNYDADYQELQSELLPNTISDGIITFPPIPPEDFELVIGGSSDNWNIRINDYKFKLEVNESI